MTLKIFDFFRTTAEFQRDVLLMLSNALMYNSSSHSVYAMAKEMHEEVNVCATALLIPLCTGVPTVL